MSIMENIRCRLGVSARRIGRLIFVLVLGVLDGLHQQRNLILQ